MVFNTPGANANAVKELVIAALLLSSREDRRRHRVGQDPEGPGGRSGQAGGKGQEPVCRPGNQGQEAWASSAWAPSACWWPTPPASLGMEVYGYDPYLSVEHAWRLSRAVHHCHLSGRGVSERAITSRVHVPQTTDTKGMVNARVPCQKMKDGVRILNFARGDLVDTDAHAWRPWTRPARWRPTLQTSPCGRHAGRGGRALPSPTWVPPPRKARTTAL